MVARELSRRALSTRTLPSQLASIAPQNICFERAFLGRFSGKRAFILSSCSIGFCKMVRTSTNCCFPSSFNQGIGEGDNGILEAFSAASLAASARSRSFLEAISAIRAACTVCTCDISSLGGDCALPALGSLGGDCALPALGSFGGDCALPALGSFGGEGAAISARDSSGPPRVPRAPRNSRETRDSATSFGAGLLALGAPAFGGDGVRSFSRGGDGLIARGCVLSRGVRG